MSSNIVESLFFFLLFMSQAWGAQSPNLGK